MLQLKTVLAQVRLLSTKLRTLHEVKIPVPWGHLAGKWWGPLDKRPILAIHGWQDNCGSYDRLISLLNRDIGVLAIDLPGHGYSSRLPPGMYYHTIDYPVLIKQISQYFKWSKVSLMGHSQGAFSCYIYTMVYPQSVDFLISLDTLRIFHEANRGPNIAERIEKFLKYDELASHKPPSYPLETLRTLVTNTKSINLEFCDYILKRNIAQSQNDPKKYYITRDPRVKSTFTFSYSQKEWLEEAQRVTAPVLMIKFTDSVYSDSKEHLLLFEVLKNASKDVQYYNVDGTHHNHLNNPQQIKDVINKFIDKHTTEDRNIGDITEVLTIA